MMTPEQHEALPALLREIVELDRDIRAMTDGTVVGFGAVQIVRDLKARRDELRERAHHTYGRVPMRGENGPGQGTAVAA